MNTIFHHVQGREKVVACFDDFTKVTGVNLSQFVALNFKYQIGHLLSYFHQRYHIVISCSHLCYFIYYQNNVDISELGLYYKHDGPYCYIYQKCNAEGYDDIQTVYYEAFLELFSIIEHPMKHMEVPF
jgi:hypothetical protein